MKSRQIFAVFLGMILLASIMPNSFALSFDLDSQINLSSNTGDSFESKVLASGDNVFVIWKDNTSGSNNILFKKSANNGTSFTSTLTLDSGSLNSQAPQMSLSGTNIYAVWQEGTSPGVIAFAKSSDTGGSFGAQVTLSSLTSTSSVPQIASSSSDVYVVYQQSNNVLFLDSGDSGSTFDSEVTLNAGISSEPKLAISGSNVYTVWTEGNDISFIKSSDTGETFDTKKNLSNTSGTISKNPEIVTPGSNVYVIWKEGTNIFFTRSTDNGGTFSSPIDIGDTGGALSPNPEISVDGTNVYVAWSERVSGSGDISFVKSSNSGASFGTRTNLSSNTGDSSLPKITSSGGIISVAWQDDTPGNDEIFLKSSDTNGASFGSAANISSNSGFSLEPEISMVGSRPYVVWEDTTPDGGGFDRDVFFVTGTESAISISFDKSQYTLNESAQITVNDSSSSNSIDITITSTSDGTGLITSLAETGAGTGVFQGTITFGDTTVGSTIQAKAGDTITADFGAQSITATIFPITIEVQISGTAFTTFDYGKIVNIQVEDKNSNTDSGVSETVTVTITSTRDTTGTSLTLTETGPDTAIFGGSSSTLIFTDGDDSVTTAGSITISQQDVSADVDPNSPDTTTISIISTSDPTGISLTLTETGNSTKTFSNQLTLTPNSSVPNSKLKVSAGDIISTTSGFFTTNALVIPNSNAAKGAISVNFTSADTVTVSYLAQSTSITVNDSAGPGGGGGGLVRPGLVVNALGGFGGGGSAHSAPSIALNDLVTNSAVDVPPEVEKMIFNHDSSIPILPMDPNSFDSFDFPLIINGNGFVLGGFENTLQTQTLKTGIPVTMKFTVYEAEKIQHFSMYMNLRDAKDTISQSDTQILYNDGKELKIVDPNGFFSDAKITVTEIEDSPITQVLVEITFAKPMDTSNIIIRSWDPNLFSRDTILLDAIKVESAEPEISPIPQVTEEVQIEELKIQTIPKWVKSNAQWWADNQIDDESFVAGIQYLINNGVMYIPNTEPVNSVTEIPGWVKNNADWWASSQISDDDFVKSMEWLVANGVIGIE